MLKLIHSLIKLHLRLSNFSVLSAEAKESYNKLDAKIDRLEAKVDIQFVHLNDKIDKSTRLLIGVVLLGGLVPIALFIIQHVH